MGCVSSHLLNQDDDFTQIATSAFSHHIVSLTSTTYGLLTLDPSSSPTTVPPTPPPRFTLASIYSTPLSDPRPDPPPELINSWELMADLDSTTDNFRFSPQPSKPSPFRYADKENLNPQNPNPNPNLKNPISKFEPLCPPKGENKIVIYTTTLRGVRRTFEDCNAVRSVFENFGVFFCERDVSMDRGFRNELWELMKGKDKQEFVPPRVFVKGMYVGGFDEVLKIVEDGNLGKLVGDLPKSKPGYVCEVCGGVRFLPCLTCNGSCKMVMVLKKEQLGKNVTVKCVDCNENGLIRCSICS